MQSRIAQYKEHQDWHEKYRKNCLDRLKASRSKAVADRRRSGVQYDTDDDKVKSEIDGVLSEEWSKLFGSHSNACASWSSNKAFSGAADLQTDVGNRCEFDFEETFDFLECIRNELLLEAREYRSSQTVQIGRESNSVAELDNEESRMSCDNDIRAVCMSSSARVDVSSSGNSEHCLARTYEYNPSSCTLLCPICASNTLSFDVQNGHVTCCACRYLLHVSPHLCDAESLRRVFDEAIASHARAGFNFNPNMSGSVRETFSQEEDIEELLQACVARPSFSIVSDGNTHNVLLSCDACDFMFLVV